MLRQEFGGQNRGEDQYLEMVRNRRKPEEVMFFKPRK